LLSNHSHLLQAHPESFLAPYGVETLWLKAAIATRTLLIVYAHPDDESFSNAGMIARYSAAGVAVHYACATRGECGAAPPELLAGHADLAALRTAELVCAARTLGMAAVHFLGYRDSGMAGAPDNQHPAALAQAPPERVAGQVAALIRTLRPQVVLTFGPYGDYGHPDHIAIHHATVTAFAAAGDTARYPEQLAAGLAPWSPARLYYSTFGTRLLRASIAMMWLTGRDPRRFGQNRDVDLPRAVAESTPITTVIACHSYLAQKERAWRCHRSQIDDMAPVLELPAPLRRLWMRYEHFTRAVPAWAGGRRERDLFKDRG
jgi:LmbE family N-acetylglucosaminyl deacetylase